MIFLLIDFYFQSGELKAVAGGFNFWTLFNAVVGSFLGFLGAYFLFNENQKKTRERDERIRLQTFNDKYNYLLLLLKKVPSKIKSQSNHFKNFADEIRANPYKIHTPIFVVNTQVPRLVENKDGESFFLAFINQGILKERPTQIEEFEWLFSHIDYYHTVLEQSLESAKGMKERVYQAMENFRNSFKEVENFAGSLIDNQELQSKHKPFVEQVDKLFQTFIPEREQHMSDLQFHFDNFLEPLLRMGISVGGYGIPEVHEMLLLVSAARRNFSSIQFQNNIQAGEFEDFSNALSNNLKEFSDRVGKLKMPDNILA